MKWAGRREDTALQEYNPSVRAQAGGGLGDVIGRPFAQEEVLWGNGPEATPLEGVVPHTGNTALVFRRARPEGHDGDAAVAGEVSQFGIQARIVPVGPEDGSLEVVEIRAVEGAAGVTERTLQGLGVLMGNAFGVGLAVKSQDDAEDPGSAAAAGGIDDRRTETKLTRASSAGSTLTRQTRSGSEALRERKKQFTDW